MPVGEPVDVFAGVQADVPEALDDVRAALAAAERGPLALRPVECESAHPTGIMGLAEAAAEKKKQAQ